jgi:hypothetical protein
MAEKPEPLAKDEAQAEDERERSPDGNELHNDFQNDLSRTQELQARPF